ncbi:MAG: NADH:flavin oxidoreductase, partial [Flavobacteriales bacterium]|nr:NADH:flavin oxidoreductase [Flavobacteriales bacterium]
TVAGQIITGKNVRDILNAGVDFVTIGRSAILHHNFPQLVMENPDFVPVANPVSREHLKSEGLGEAFVNYMSGWPGFVAEH